VRAPCVQGAVSAQLLIHLLHVHLAASAHLPLHLPHDGLVSTQANCHDTSCLPCVCASITRLLVGTAFLLLCIWTVRLLDNVRDAAERRQLADCHRLCGVCRVVLLLALRRNSRRVCWSACVARPTKAGRCGLHGFSWSGEA
jgi:hypothetical protein